MHIWGLDFILRAVGSGCRTWTEFCSDLIKTWSDHSNAEQLIEQNQGDQVGASVID